MTAKDNILQELKELGSELAPNHPNPYTVPAGYFEGLAATMLARVKAIEAKNPKDELLALSPFLSGLDKQIPYAVPAGYFEGLAEAVAQTKSSTGLSATDELSALSPLLGGMNKKMPYTVPAGYFDNISQPGSGENTVQQSKIISITKRKWFRYAAAAVLAGIIATTAFLFTRDTNQEPGSAALAAISRDVKEMNETQQDDLIDFIAAGITDDETAKINTTALSEEVKSLLKGISEEELKDFQEQTEDVQDVLMTN